MAHLKIYKDKHVDSTVIPNLFIDEYMEDANDTQLKVYLYLIRMLNAGMATSVSDIAEKFGHTEKNVLRAMKYWEKHKLLSLEYDEDKNLVGVQICDLIRQEPSGSELKLKSAEAAPAAVTESMLKTPSAVTDSVAKAPSAVTDSVTKAPSAVTDSVAKAPSAVTETEQKSPAAAAEAILSSRTVTASEIAAPAFVKPSYSAEQIRQFCNDESIEELLFLAQTYVGKTLTASDMKTVIFFSDVLHFSNDLIDYLLQYCVELGKKDFRYIEKVALNWAEQGISTPEEAYESCNKYSKSVYTIMNALGKSNTPSNKEMEYITRWIKEYCFSLDIIVEACNRTVLATDKHRFEYTEGILRNWKQHGIVHQEDIALLDSEHQKTRTKSTASKPVAPSGNKFNQFPQATYDFAELERQLLSN